MLDKSILDEFRDLVNSKSDYLLHNYLNHNGKNRWNVICSAMDWISVGVDSINTLNLETKSRSEIYKEVLLFISMIDVIYESIVQLSRVIPNAPKLNKISNNIFSENEFLDDARCFKHIRAVFGAHPVNLNPYQDKDKRWYAAWPYQDYGSKYDLQVYLYPMDTDEEMKIFGIKIDELETFVKEIYAKLKIIEECIVNNYISYVSDCKSKVIEYTGVSMDDATIALDELSKRMSNDYYEDMLKDTISYLNTNLSVEDNRVVVDEYLKQIKFALEEIKICIQNVDYHDLEAFEIKYV